jgi:hypothetical protein
VKEPTAGIRLDDPREPFLPGETLSGSYSLVGDLPAGPLQSVELSVGWSTEGKGDEDTGVHLFEAEDHAPAGPGKPRRFSTVLPRSPLSYDGQIVKIRWWVRARYAFGRREVFIGEVPFRLGDVPRPEGEPS